MNRAVRQAVFVAPAERDELERMRRAHAAAGQQFRVSASGPEVLRWREMIRLDTKAAVPGSILTAVPSALLEPAGHVLEVLDLW